MDTRDRPRNCKTSDYSLQSHEAHEPVQNDLDLGLGQSSDRGAAELGTADGAAVLHQGRWGDAGTPTSSNRIHAEDSRPKKRRQAVSSSSGIRPMPSLSASLQEGGRARRQRCRRSGTNLDPAVAGQARCGSGRMASVTASGLRSITLRRTSAAPWGVRSPRSQWRRVATENPKRPANWSCVNPSRRRSLATSTAWERCSRIPLGVPPAWAAASSSPCLMLANALMVLLRQFR